MQKIEELLKNPKVVAVGEIGIDRHIYQITKYEDYVISDRFIDLQKKVFEKQMLLAIEYNKSLVIHNREAKDDVLILLEKNWNDSLRNKTVLHCCEADEELLDYAIKRDIYIGVDGDVTYSKKKQRFIEKVPLERLVIETDSPYLTPEPIRQVARFPNVPTNLKDIVEKVADVKNIPSQDIVEITTKNAKELFSL
jgi:TatD DNase family protein